MCFLPFAAMAERYLLQLWHHRYKRRWHHGGIRADVAKPVAKWHDTFLQKFAHAHIRKMNVQSSGSGESTVCDDAVFDYDSYLTSYVKLSAAESAFFLILCLLIITGNLSVMIWRCRRRREVRNSIPSLLVVNLAAADLLLGIQLVIFLYLYSWSCSVLILPNEVELMTSLCYVSGVMEGTSILVSGMITYTIAFYYANVVFGKRCCCCLTHICIIVFLFIGWVVALGLGIGTAMFSPNQFPGHNTSIASLYAVTPHAQENLTNATFSIVMLQNCIPITSFLKDAASFALHGKRTNKATTFTLPSVVEEIAGITFGIDFLLIGAAAGIYIIIADKLRRSRESVVSNRLGGLGFRLIAIAIVTFFGWAAFTILLFPMYVTYLEQLLPLAIVALCNPLTFTLTSAPFCKTVKTLKRIILFKLNRPVLIQDITDDDDDEERLIATGSPSESSMKDFSSLAESD